MNRKGSDFEVDLKSASHLFSKASFSHAVMGWGRDSQTLQPNGTGGGGGWGWGLAIPFEYYWAASIILGNCIMNTYKLHHHDKMIYPG